jgi:hypothetical protein
MAENRAPKRIFGPMRNIKYKTGEHYIMISFIIYTPSHILLEF